MNLNSIYYFSSVVALHDVEVSGNMNKFFFYDGEALKDTPANCINVPISQFFDYFLKTTYPQISQLNFDGTEFGDETKSQITQSITQTILAIKNQKMEILNTLLQAEITQKNLNVMIYTFLKYLLENELDSKIVVKLIYITEFLKTRSFKLDVITNSLISQLLLSKKEKTNMHNINLNYILKFLSVNTLEVSTLELEYLQQIAQYRDLNDICTNLFYVQQLFTNKRHLDYITLYAKVLFTDEFFSLDIIEQKERVYKIFYCNNTIFNFGNNYKELYRLLCPIFLQAIEKEQDELVMFLYYPLQYSWNAVSQTQEEFAQFNDEVELKLESFIKNKLISKYNIKPNLKEIKPNKKKIKVAFLIYRVLGLSVNNVMSSLLQALKDENSEKYEFVVYDLNFKETGGSEEKEVEKLKKMGIKYVDLHKECSKNISVFYSIVEKCLNIREYLMKEDIDILIGHHSRAEYNFLFTTRTATKQIYWSHGNFEYNIDAIDQRISHITNKSKYKYTYFPIQTLKKFLNNQSSETLSEIKELKEKYKEYSIIFGSIGRLSKMNNIEYLTTIASILKKYPDSIYLACGSGNTSAIQKTLNELGVEDRVYFVGVINPHAYGAIIDIYLNTFPETGGESITEFKAKGSDKFVVSLTGNLDRYIEDTINIIKYKALDIKKLENSKPDNNMLKITSDKPQTKEDADFVIYLLEKYDNILYIEPTNEEDNFQAYIRKSVSKDKLSSNMGNIAENIINCDLYIVFYISEMRNLAMFYKKVIYNNNPSKYSNGKTSDSWNNAFKNKKHMMMIKQLLSKEKQYNKAKKDSYSIFSLFHTKAGLTTLEQKIYWNYEADGLDRIRLFFDLAIKNKEFANIYQEVHYTHSTYLQSPLKLGATEFIEILK